MRFTARTLALIAGLSLAGCKGEKAPTPDTAGGAQPTASAVEPKPPEKPAQKPVDPASGFPLGNPQPSGPPLQVLPGQGVGPIRFGATFATVARHMQRPCDERTETRCLYIDQAVDFTMKDGVVDGIYAVRRDRPAPPRANGKPRYFGTFFGGLPPDLSLGVHKHIVLEELSPPERIETLPTPDQNGTVERHYYDGLVLEFDKLPNGNTVLGAIRVSPSKTAKNPYKGPSTTDKLGLPPPRIPQSITPKSPMGAGSDFLNPEDKPKPPEQNAPPAKKQ